MGMALWTGLFYHEPALLSPFYPLYSDHEPPIHHSGCDELEARMLYLPTEEELREELAPGHERPEVAPRARWARAKPQASASFIAICRTQCVLATLDLTQPQP